MVEDMKTQFANRAPKLSVVILAGLLLAVRSSSAQWVEVSFQLESVIWPASPSVPLPPEHRHTNTVRCVFGSTDLDLWSVEGDFLSNAKATYWGAGTEVIEHYEITRKRTEREEKDQLDARLRPLMRSPQVGKQATHARVGLPHRPPPLGTTAQITWLAFCSGHFLKSDGRQLARPVYPDNEDLYSEKTRLFKDSVGLPERLGLYTPDGGTLVCVYNVLQSTNVFGLTVPTWFKYEEYQPFGAGAGYIARRDTGTVTVIRKSAEPLVPPEVMDEAQSGFH
jgi:hypothetical protein